MSTRQVFINNEQLKGIVVFTNPIISLDDFICHRSSNKLRCLCEKLITPYHALWKATLASPYSSSSILSLSLSWKNLPFRSTRVLQRRLRSRQCPIFMRMSSMRRATPGSLQVYSRGSEEQQMVIRQRQQLAVRWSLAKDGWQMSIQAHFRGHQTPGYGS